MPVAVCDLGSFSALILIVDGTRHPLHEERITVDLVTDPITNEITEPGFRRAATAVERFERLARRYKCSRTTIVATAAIRDATNRVGILHALGSHPSSTVTVLTPHREGILTAHGALTGLNLDPDSALVIDVGGGSTELVKLPTQVTGLPIGAARATQLWNAQLPGNAKRRHVYLLERARAAVAGLHMPRWNTVVAVAVGGTVTTLAATQLRMTHFDQGRIHGSTLTRRWICDRAAKLSQLDLHQLKPLLPFDPSRAPVLVAGTYLWTALLEKLDIDRVIVSSRGLRWGVAEKLLQNPAT